MAWRGRAGWRWVAHIYLNVILSWLCHPDEVKLVLWMHFRVSVTGSASRAFLAWLWRLNTGLSVHSPLYISGRHRYEKKWYSFISSPTLLTFVACILADPLIRRRRNCGLTDKQGFMATFRPLFASNFNWQPFATFRSLSGSNKTWDF